MANSDNVLRGGLTPKHVDVPELQKVLRFEPTSVDILWPQKLNATEKRYACPAAEFMLSVISTTGGSGFISKRDRYVEILFCSAGQAQITDLQKNDSRQIEKGMAVLIPAAVESYKIEGDAVIYKASVPKTA